jgi:hypothetical protein
MGQKQRLPHKAVQNPTSKAKPGEHGGIRVRVDRAFAIRGDGVGLISVGSYCLCFCFGSWKDFRSKCWFLYLQVLWSGFLFVDFCFGS